MSREKRPHFSFLTFHISLGYHFQIYILLHIKKHYIIHFCCLFLKSSKAFSVSLILWQQYTVKPCYSRHPISWTLFMGMGEMTDKLSKKNFHVWDKYRTPQYSIHFSEVLNDFFSWKWRLYSRQNIGYHKTILPQETYVLLEAIIYAFLIVLPFLLVFSDP